MQIFDLEIGHVSGAIIILRTVERVLYNTNGVVLTHDVDINCNVNSKVQSCIFNILL